MVASHFPSPSLVKPQSFPVDCLAASSSAASDGSAGGGGRGRGREVVYATATPTAPTSSWERRRRNGGWAAAEGGAAHARRARAMGTATRGAVISPPQSTTDLGGDLGWFGAAGRHALVARRVRRARRRLPSPLRCPPSLPPPFYDAGSIHHAAVHRGVAPGRRTRAARRPLRAARRARARDSVRRVRAGCAMWRGRREVGAIDWLGALVRIGRPTPSTPPHHQAAPRAALRPPRAPPRRRVRGAVAV